MQNPLQLSFRNMDRSDAVEADVRDRVNHLERYFDRMIGCRVIVEAPHRRHNKGKLFSVRIAISVPGDEIVIAHEGPTNRAHEDVYVAVRDAFAAAQRRLQDHARRVRGAVKSHEVPLHGRIARVFADGYGFIATPTGEEVYFHRNSLVEGRFEDLVAGSEVRFEVAYDESEHGPQATTVRPIGKHHLIDER
jgi:ribosomal subunit interface protein